MRLKLASPQLSVWAELSDQLPQTVEDYGKEKIATLQKRNLTSTTYLSKWWRLASPVTGHTDIMYPRQDGMRRAISSVVVLPKTHNLGLNMRKTSESLKLRDSLQNTCRVPFKTVKVTENKETLRNHLRWWTKRRGSQMPRPCRVKSQDREMYMTSTPSKSCAKPQAPYSLVYQCGFAF